MVAWWWVMVGYVIGQIIAMGAIAICMANEPKEQEHKYIKK